MGRHAFPARVVARAARRRAVRGVGPVGTTEGISVMTVEATAPVLSEETVRIWDGELAIRVKSSGSGAPLVYLHRAAGLRWDHFLGRLSTLRAVYAPEFPGASADDPYAVHATDDISDLVLAYEKAIGRLGV